MAEPAGKRIVTAMHAVHINLALSCLEQMLDSVMDSIEESLPVKGTALEYDGQLHHFFLLNNDDTNDVITFSDGQTATIEWCADGPAAKIALLRENNPCDFAIVGEPAATAFGTPNGGGFSARMDLQAMYKAVNGNDSNFPQASLFVKTSLTKDAEFISALLKAFEDNRDWVQANPAEVTAKIQEKGSTTTFPAPSIPRCAIVVNKADNTVTQEAIITYLSLMIPSVNWAEVDLF